MENVSVICDVHACAHNVNGDRCNLSEIKVTEHCNCANSTDIPHFCCSYQQR